MKIIRVTFLASALAILAGCVAVPVEPGYYAEPPGYYAPPAFYVPSFSVGIFAGGHRHGHGQGHGRGRGRGRR